MLQLGVDVIIGSVYGIGYLMLVVYLVWVMDVWGLGIVLVLWVDLGVFVDDQVGVGVLCVIGGYFGSGYVVG